MKLLFSFLIVMSPLFAGASFFSAELAAKSTADFLNSTKTVEGAIEALSAGATPTEAQGIRQLFSEMKIKMDAKLPKAIAVGSKVTFEKSSEAIVFNDDRTFSVNGHVYRPYQLGTLDQFLRNAADKMNGKETGLMGLMLPKAHASDLGAGMALGFRILAIGAAGSAVAIGSVAIYGGKEIYETLKNNSIICDGPYFKLRTKTRNMALLASSKENVLDPEKINQVFGEKVTCDNEKAAKLQSMIKAEPAKGKQLSPGSAPPGTR